MPTFTNVAAYKFAPLADLKPLRDRLRELAHVHHLKGTILLATEGINLFVAGQPEDVDVLFNTIRSFPGLEGLEAKYSESEQQPFTRMLVKIKKEIIAFGIEGIDPARDPAPKLSPRELKKWLDEGRPVTLLDTRNEFEIELGTFRNATRIGMAHFREFPAAVEKLPEELKQRPIVAFCTGGIRCEKAAPYLRKQGFANVLQLDGGILKYFEECGREHYDGECFVFDKRVGLDPELNESGRSLCFVCQSPLEQSERADPRYIEGVSCPRCFQSSEEKRLQELNEHQALIAKVTNPLPGSVPYENVRPLNVPARTANRPILDFLTDILPQYSLEKWLSECDSGRVLDSEFFPASATHIVREGERYYHRQPLAAEPDVNAGIRILHEDAAIIVVNKPAPLPVHPCGRFNKNTLQAILREVFAPQKPRPAHRLDANTTGVTVFTRTVQFAKFVQSQFERGEVEKRYLARVIGHPTDDVFTCEAPIREAAGEAGSRDVDVENGLQARTDFRVLDRRSDGTSLVEAIPLTGRTNQIRIHLWHLGWPILGDRTYLPGGTLGVTQTLPVGDPPLCLHARRLSFVHPLTGQRTAFEADPPSWVS